MNVYADAVAFILFVNGDGIPVDEHGFRPLREHGYDGANRAGNVKIVRIEPAKNLPGGAAHPLIDSICLTLIWLANPL